MTRSNRFERRERNHRRCACAAPTPGAIKTARWIYPAVAVFSIFAAVNDAGAQSSVTTFGTSLARDCYLAAADGLTTDSTPCDRALREEALRPKDRRATLVNRGVILNRAGEYRRAIADFDAVLAEQPALGEALLNRGNAQFMLGRLDAALGDYEAAVASAFEKTHVAWYNIGLVRAAQGDKAGAEEAFCMSLALSPTFGPARAKLGDAAGACAPPASDGG